MVAGNHMKEEREEGEALRRHSGYKEIVNPLFRVPTEKPPFTFSQLKNAIPPHCFQRSALRSFAYLIHDVLISGVLFYIAVTLFPALPSPFHLIAWPFYWASQGCVLTGIWVIAHECGHHAFSEFSILDDAVGLVLHSFLLVPYFSWKYSHRRHHSNTGSIDWDEVYIPKHRSALPWFSPYINNPLGRVLTLTITIFLGFPMYLLFNVSGRPYSRFASHYDPYSPIYNERERTQIFISDAGILAVFYLLYRFASSYSLACILCLYGAPLLVVNAWFIIITYIHHTHRALPHYDSTEWDWLRGALATVDRDFGFLNRIFHDVTHTHVAHHLFSTIPHYHAMEATKAIRPILGNYYRFDDTPVLKALWREASECVYVEPDKGKERSKGVLWYRNEL